MKTCLANTKEISTPFFQKEKAIDDIMNRLGTFYDMNKKDFEGLEETEDSWRQEMKVIISQGFQHDMKMLPDDVYCKGYN